MWNDGANTWHPDVFVEAVLELAPSSLSWKEVVREFDHAEFFIKDKMALRFVVYVLRKALQRSASASQQQQQPEPFPIEYIYRTWDNPEGQLSWIIHSLKHPDVFCLADHPSRRTVTECLKAQPEDDNKLIASWRSLNLLETLLTLSEAGVYSNCVELFKFPITHCPDLLLLGLLQLNVSCTLTHVTLLLSIIIC